MVKSAPTRHDRKFWERVVAAAELGDAAHAEVAARYGVRVSTLRTWIYQLRRERRSRTHGGVRVLPVAVTPPAAATATIEVRVGELELRVPPGTEPAYVAALLHALRAC